MIPCHDCQKQYVGETKRYFETGHKELIADDKDRRFDKSALTRHVFDLGHSMDWQQLKVLEFECDFHKCRLIESYYVKTDCSSMKDKSSDMFPDVYRYIVSCQTNDNVHNFIRFNICALFHVPLLVHRFVSASNCID